jgi:hypothetical protein
MYSVNNLPVPTEEKGGNASFGEELDLFLSNVCTAEYVGCTLYRNISNQLPVTCQRKGNFYKNAVKKSTFLPLPGIEPIFLPCSTNIPVIILATFCRI